MREQTAALLGVVVLVAVPVFRAAEVNVVALQLAKALSPSHGPCRVHRALCMPVGTSPDAERMGQWLERSTIAKEFSAQGAALAYAAAGDVSRAQHLWERTTGNLAKLNLGRLYWSTRQDEQALRTWRAAGSPVWLANFLLRDIDPGSVSEPTSLLISFVLDDLHGTYDAHILAGLVGLRFSRYESAVVHFRQALVFRPGDRPALMRLAQGYGSGPRQQLTRADHAAIATHMEAAVRFDPGYSDLHVLAAVSACLGRADYSTAVREADTARRLGFGRFPDDLTEGLARRCEAVR